MVIGGSSTSDFLLLATPTLNPAATAILEVAPQFKMLRPGLWAASFGPDDQLDPVPATVICGTPVSAVPGVTEAALARGRDYANLVGPFAVLNVDEDGGVDVVADPLGIQPLYRTTIPDGVIVSTRADLLATLRPTFTGTPCAKHPGRLEELTVMGTTLDGETVWPDVELASCTDRVRVDPASTTMRAEPCWSPPWDAESVMDSAIDGELDAILHRQLGALRNLVASQANGVNVDLTGGKDSRLVLAMCKLAEVLHDVQFVTRGPADAPDTILATHIAGRLGLYHQQSGWEAPWRPWVEEYVARVRAGSGRAGAFQEIDPHVDQQWRVQGFVGEIWRTNYSYQRPGLTLDSVLDEFVRRRVHPGLQFLAPSVHAQVVERTLTHFRGMLDRGVDRDDLLDCYYIQQRLRNWMGSRPRSFDRALLPLYAPAAARVALGTGLSARLDDVLARRLLDRAELGIDDVPYTKILGQQARITLAPTPAPAPKPRAPDVEAPSTLRALLGGGRLRPKLGTRRAALAHLFGRPGDDAYEFLNRRAIHAAVTQFDQLSRPDRLRLHDALAAKLWLEPGSFPEAPPTGRSLS